MASSRALAVALVLVAACSRTTLSPSGGAATGAGGAGAQGGAGPGGAGPGGAGPGGAGPGGSGGGEACLGLASVEPRVALPAIDAFMLQRDPLLLPMRQGRVLALVRRLPPESPGPVPNSIQAGVLEPWSAWPPTSLPPVQAFDASEMVPFVASVEPTGTFALGAEMFPFNAPPGCTIAAIYGISPENPALPDTLFLPLNGACDDAPIAIATAGSGVHFVANDIPIAGMPTRMLVPHVFDAAGGTILSPLPTCASTRMVGDVIAGEQGFLFAHSTAFDDDCFIPDNGLPGPARRMKLRRFGVNDDKGEVVYEGVDDIVFARLLPRSDGAWLVLQESGASAEVQPPAMAIRLSDDKPGVPFPVTSEGTSQVAAAALGDGLVVAFVDSVDPSAPTIILRVFSADGTALGATSFGTNDAWLHFDRLALVGSPAGNSILVGWIGDTPDMGSAAWLRRFDCVGGL